MVKIGNIEINSKVVLAPMAGISNSAFRRICKSMGADLVYAEMVSDKAITYGNEKTFELLRMNDDERPISQQIFGSDITSFVVAAKYIEETMHPDIIDINMLLSEVLESFSLIFKINNVDLINKVTDDEIYINGDYDRLKQVFINLIKNGIESFDGKNGKLEIKSKENNKEVIISIIDNGCGMDEEVFKNINKMFYTTKKNGTGIGLPLSNEIIKLHNGRINLYSKKGEGTTVEIIFNKIDMI